MVLPSEWPTTHALSCRGSVEEDEEEEEEEEEESDTVREVEVAGQ